MVIQNGNVTNVLESVKSNDGVLIFESDEHMYGAMYELSFLNSEKRRAWENKHNFISLFTIEEMVHEAEDQHQSEFYKGIDPMITITELNSLNLNYVPSELFQEYQTKKLVSYTQEKDGSNSIVLNFNHTMYKQITGEKLAVQFGDILLKFENDIMLAIDINSNKILWESNRNDLEKNGNHKWHKGIGVSPGYRSHYRFFPDANNTNSNFRVMSYIEFDSKLFSNNSNDPDKLAAQLNMFWVNAAQEKKWGNWALRNSFNPISGMLGQWYIWYQYTTFTMPSPDDFYTAYHGVSSGEYLCRVQPNAGALKQLNANYGASPTNNVTFTGMQPSGIYNSLSWWNFKTPFNAFQDNYHINLINNGVVTPYTLIQ